MTWAPFYTAQLVWFHSLRINRKTFWQIPGTARLSSRPPKSNTKHSWFQVQIGLRLSENQNLVFCIQTLTSSFFILPVFFRLRPIQLKWGFRKSPVPCWADYCENAARAHNQLTTLLETKAFHNYQNLISLQLTASTLCHLSLARAAEDKYLRCSWHLYLSIKIKYLARASFSLMATSVVLATSSTDIL